MLTSYRLAGWGIAFYDTQKFVVGQAPNAKEALIPHPSVKILAYQLGNLYLLLLFVGVGVLYFTSEAKVIRNYLIALAIADVGHIYSTYLGIGWKALIEVNKWNDLMWGNVGISTFLFVNRVAYLLGMFGNASGLRSGKKLN
ncbi:hypothetical protein PRK78_002957 [Emydomyces testavorans]|uniref:DUF7704 domain-containing protein n=1 Tax=Emydomyces testavorans TaxID=2070801 RepID=A0AAF0IH05_9EURO|nr:hypothetical protein PRK78_002957 [Emydomyces testavorans]